MLVSLLMWAGVNAMRPMVTYRAISLDAGPTEIGIIAAAFGVLSLMVVLPAGHWIDRLGEPLFITSGVVIMGVVALGLANSVELFQIAMLMAFLGVGQILNAAASQTMIANGGSESGRDGRFGTYTVSASLGQLVGPALAGFVVAGAIQAEGGDPRTASVHVTDGVFLFAAAGSLIAFVAALTLWRWPPPEHARRDQTDRPKEPVSTVAALGQVLRVPAMPAAMLASLTVLSSIDILAAYLPAYGVVNGIPIEAIGLLLAVRAAASVGSRAMMIPLRKRVGRRRLLVGSMIVPAVMFVAIPFIGIEIWPLAIAMVFIGFGLGLGQPLTMSWVATRAPVEIRGTALGLRLSGNRFGQFALPAMIGLIAGAAGLSIIFWCLGGLLLVSAALVMRATFEAPAALDSRSGSPGPPSSARYAHPSIRRRHP